MKNLKNILLGEERWAQKIACFFSSFLSLSVKGRSTVARRGRGRILMTQKHKGVFRVTEIFRIVTEIFYIVTEIFRIGYSLCIFVRTH